MRQLIFSLTLVLATLQAAHPAIGNAAPTRTKSHGNGLAVPKADCCRPDLSNGKCCSSNSQAKASTTGVLENEEDNPVRLKRISTASLIFMAPPAGIAQRWLRNMRNPTFCPFAMCHGTCSAIMGQFVIGGSCSPTETSDSPAPCSIRKVDFFAEPGSGCCSSAPGSRFSATKFGDRPGDCCGEHL